MAPKVVTCAPGLHPRAGTEMNDVGIVEDGAVVVCGDTITAVGPSREILEEWQGPERLYPHRCLVPGLVDAHSHPVFAGSRVNEFVMRAQGATYQEIHAAGGGIAATVAATRQATDLELETLALERVQHMLRNGTTTMEAKSGYGLSTEEEIRHLRVIRSMQGHTPVEIVPTFMGAHAIPAEFTDSRQAFVDLICQDMLAAVKAEGLAEFGDVFCEEGAFTVDESRRILEACKRSGLGLRIHAEEFSYQGAARMAAGLGATSADHLQYLPKGDFGVLKAHRTIPVLMPGTSFFLGLDSYAPARGMLEAGLPVALGSDFNAGSNMSESMQMAMSLAVLRLKMTPEEALIAATVNAAHSLRRGARVGSLEVGKQADILVVNLRDIREWPYHYGVNLVEGVCKKGRKH